MQETRWKYAVPFAGIVIAYLKDREFVFKLMSIDKFFGVSGISLSSLCQARRIWIFFPIFLTSPAVTETFPILSNLSSHGSGMLGISY